jgi:catechol 2,3-dioxygenase-like lactoylglutathione lyase family enzyme
LRLTAAGADVGQVQRLGGTLSLFFRDPDGMELEICTPSEES